MTTYKYTTRAEAFIDVSRFLNREELFGKIDCFEIKQNYKKFGLDTIFEFQSDLSKEEIVWIMEEIPDSHIMIRNLIQEVIFQEA